MADMVANIVATSTLTSRLGIAVRRRRGRARPRRQCCPSKARSRHLNGPAGVGSCKAICRLRDLADHERNRESTQQSGHSPSGQRSRRSRGYSGNVPAAGARTAASPACRIGGVQGNVRGSTAAPHLTGQLSASHFEANGTAWKVFRAGLDANPSQVALRNAELDPEPKGQITLNASATLNQWAFSKNSPVNVDLNASQLDLASLEKMAGQTFPITGTLNTQVAAHGSLMNPIGNGSLTVTNANAYDQPITALRVTFSGTSDQAQANLQLRLPAGDVNANVTVRPKERTYAAQLTSPGITIQKLQAVQAKDLHAEGVVELNASGQGSFSDPQLTASLRIPQLTVQGQTAANITLNADVANHTADATLDSSALNTQLQAKAHIQLTGDYETDATLNTRGIPLQPIVAMFSPDNAESLTGQTELHATLRGPLKNWPRCRRTSPFPISMLPTTTPSSLPPPRP